MSTQEIYIIFSIPFESVIWKAFLLGRSHLPHLSFLYQIHTEFLVKTTYLILQMNNNWNPGSS